MHKWIFRVGWVATFFYVCALIFTIVTRRDELWSMHLNELGDFLAGAFGPLAFLWLVLGFIQQGQELRQGTEALLLQAEELKRSVEQQALLATSATQQVEVQREEARRQQLEKERLMCPQFEFRSKGHSISSDRTRPHFVFVNEGADVKSVLITFSPSVFIVSEFAVGRLRNRDFANLVFEFRDCPVQSVGECVVSYVRADGEKLNEKFVYKTAVEPPFLNFSSTE